MPMGDYAICDDESQIKLKNSYTINRIGSLYYAQNNKTLDTNVVPSSTTFKTVLDSLTALLTGVGGIISLNANTVYGPIAQSLNLPDDVGLEGDDWTSILDFSTLPGNQANSIINMGVRGSLRNLKCRGDISTLPTVLETQKIQMNDFCKVDNLFLTDLGYGIALDGADHCWVRNYRAENLKMSTDWAAAFHGTNCNDNHLDNFYFLNCNRGCEMDAGSTNMFIRDGYLENIQNFNGSGNEAFSIDAHSHDGEGGNDNVYYDNIYLKNCNGPTAKHAGSGYADADMPRNVHFRNITIDNQKATMFLAGWNLTARNIKFVNCSLVDDIAVGRNSRHILIDNTENLDSRTTKRHFVFSFNDCDNITLRHFKVNCNADKDPNNHNIINLNIATPNMIRIENGRILNAKGFAAISVTALCKAVIRNCLIGFASSTPANYGIWCAGRDCILDSNEIQAGAGIADIVLRDGAIRTDVSRNKINQSYIWIRNTASFSNLHDNIIAPTLQGINIEATATELSIRDNINYRSQNGGVATFSGNGSNTVFTIAHGLKGAPLSVSGNGGYVFAIPNSDNARGDFKVTYDATNLTITYAVAPPSGTNNVVLVWSAKM